MVCGFDRTGDAEEGKVSVARSLSRAAPFSPPSTWTTRERLFSVLNHPRPQPDRFDSRPCHKNRVSAMSSIASGDRFQTTIKLQTRAKGCHLITNEIVHALGDQLKNVKVSTTGRSRLVSAMSPL